MPVEITWWGHATVAVRDSGVRVLTDPLLVPRLAHLRRRRGAALLAEPWEGMAAAVTLTLLISAAPTVQRRLRPVRDA